MTEKMYSIPVPESKLQAVYAVLGAGPTTPSANPAFGGASPAHRPSAEHPSEGSAEKEGFWTADLVARLRNEYKNQTVRKLFDLCATGHPVSMKQVMQATGASMPTVRAGLAGLTMFLKSRYGASGLQDWPVTPFYRGNDLMYRMSPQIASWWKDQT